jgi:hypothetical protein
MRWYEVRGDYEIWKVELLQSWKFWSWKVRSLNSESEVGIGTYPIKAYRKLNL